MSRRRNKQYVHTGNLAGPLFYYLAGPVCFWVAVSLNADGHLPKDFLGFMLLGAWFSPFLALYAKRIRNYGFRVWPDRGEQWFHVMLFLTCFAVVGLIYGIEKSVFRASKFNQPLSFTPVVDSVLFTCGCGAWVATFMGSNFKFLRYHLRTRTSFAAKLPKLDGRH